MSMIYPRPLVLTYFTPAGSDPRKVASWVLGVLAVLGLLLGLWAGARQVYEIHQRDSDKVSLLAEFHAVPERMVISPFPPGGYGWTWDYSAIAARNVWTHPPGGMNHGQLVHWYLTFYAWHLAVRSCLWTLLVSCVLCLLAIYVHRGNRRAAGAGMVATAALAILSLLKAALGGYIFGAHYLVYGTLPWASDWSAHYQLLEESQTYQFLERIHYDPLYLLTHSSHPRWYWTGLLVLGPVLAVLMIDLLHYLQAVRRSAPMTKRPFGLPAITA